MDVKIAFMVENADSLRAPSYPDDGRMHDASSFPPKELGKARIGEVLTSADSDDQGHAYEENPTQIRITDQQPTIE